MLRIINEYIQNMTIFDKKNTLYICKHEDA